jgi:hypothetical protein
MATGDPDIFATPDTVENSTVPTKGGFDGRSDSTLTGHFAKLHSVLGIQPMAAHWRAEGPGASA